MLCFRDASEAPWNHHLDSLVDLGRAGELLRFLLAQDGAAAFESEQGRFERFWLDAVGFSCGVQPVLTTAYEAVLARLTR